MYLYIIIILLHLLNVYYESGTLHISAHYSQNSPLVGPIHIYVLYIYSRTYPILQMIKLRFSELELLVSGNSSTLTQAA